MLHPVTVQLSLITEKLARGDLSPDSLPFEPCDEAAALLADIKSGKYYDDLTTAIVSSKDFGTVDLNTIPDQFRLYMQATTDIINKSTGKTEQHPVSGVIGPWHVHGDCFVWTFCDPAFKNSIWASYRCGSQHIKPGWC